MILDGFAIAGYRSFGPELVQIGDLAKINIFIGKNNSGKSNILRFCRILSRKKKTFSSPFDHCLDITNNTISYAIQIKKDSNTSTKYNLVKSVFKGHWDRLFPDCSNSIWFSYTAQGSTDQTTFQEFAKTFEKECTLQELQTFLETANTSYNRTDHGANSRLLSQILHEKVTFEFNAHMISAFRKISDDINSEDPLSGAELIKKLRSIQSPILKIRDKSKDRFQKINYFVKELLAEPDAFIEIPADEDVIYVSIKGKILPLNSLGTGIHELIILAAAVTLFDDVVFCIEEPEIHLHPQLQKKFVRYLNERTNNQYLITTHSNAFFDMPAVNVYHCWLENGHTQCQLATLASEKHEILSELGYKPSDILLANFIIWVEGPSDKIYLSNWIKSKAPDLVDGLDYTIMFYGGSLLKHCAYDNNNLEEFIQLAKLNRNAAIMMDSDRTKKGEKLDAKKLRVRKDFEENNQFVWVTEGRTIENYIPEAVFNAAVAEVHSRTECHFQWQQFADMTHLPKEKIINKVAVARKVTIHEVNYPILDLDRMVDKLIQKIRTVK